MPLNIDRLELLVVAEASFSVTEEATGGVAIMPADRRKESDTRCQWLVDVWATRSAKLRRRTTSTPAAEAYDLATAVDAAFRPGRLP